MTLLDSVIGAQKKALIVSGGCHNCRMRRVDFVPATLRAGPVLWLGEAPGQTEVETGEGFTGKSGELLRREALSALVPEPWSFSNTIKCRPPENAVPHPDAIKCCLSQFALEEIKDYPFVVLAGAVPLNALFPGAKATHFRGNVAYHPDFPDTRFYAMYHPAYVLRNPYVLPLYQQQMARLGRLVRGEDTVQPWTIVRGMQPLLEVLAHPLVSLDLETTGADSWAIGAHIRTLGATADGVTVVTVHETEPHFIAAMEAVRRFMEDPTKHVVGSNVAYDVEWGEREGEYTARLQGIHDVGLIAYEAWQYQHPSLKQLVAEQLDGYRFLIHQPHLWTYPPELEAKYNAEDVVHSLALFKKGMAALRPQTRDLVSRVFGPMSLVLRRATTHGLYVRQDYRQKKLDEYAEKRRAVITAWRDEDPDFIPDEMESGKGLMTYLFKMKQLPVLGETETGQAVVDKAVIKQWVRDGATYLQHLLDMREIDKLVSTYLKAYDAHVGPDSRVHPSHWMTSTDTSRPSSSDPNVYNIPRNREIRDLFGVPRGYRLVESDLSQIEFRIMVCRAKDENGIAGYLRGDDAHTMTARTISGNPHPTKAQRSDAKPVNFALLYGGEWPVVQRQARDDFGVDWDEGLCRKFTGDFFATYPRIKPFHNDCIARLAQNRGWFESVTGHVFYYRDWNHEDLGKREHTQRSAINSEGQGPAANICYYISVLARQLWDARGFERVKIVNSVYDSIMTEVPDPAWVPAVIETINEAARLAQQWVSRWFVVPLVIEHAVGESWGSLEPWKP